MKVGDTVWFPGHEGRELESGRILEIGKNKEGEPMYWFCDSRNIADTEVGFPASVVGATEEAAAKKLFHRILYGETNRIIRTIRLVNGTVQMDIRHIDEDR